MLKRLLGRFMVVVAILFLLGAATMDAVAQTDITSTVTALSGYWTAIATVAIAVLLFVVGRRLVRKL